MGGWMIDVVFWGWWVVYWKPPRLIVDFSFTLWCRRILSIFQMFPVEAAGWLILKFSFLCSPQVRKNNRESVYPSQNVLLIFKWFHKYFPKYFLISWRLNNSKFLISQKIRKSLSYFRAYVGRFMIKYGGAPPTRAGWISQYLSKCLQQFIKYTPAGIGPDLAISIKLGLITHYLEFHNNILNYKLTAEGWEYVQAKAVRAPLDCDSQHRHNLSYHLNSFYFYLRRSSSMIDRSWLDWTSYLALSRCSLEQEWGVVRDKNGWTAPEQVVPS